jgi:hypothetical protein
MTPKTYRAIRHDVVRKRQKENCQSTIHTFEKEAQINRVLAGRSGLKILELFAGEGNLTKVYSQFGQVESYDKKLNTGDSFLVHHWLISLRQKFSVIDLDPYGFPTRFLPDIYLLIDDGFLFVTMPIPSVNILHAITKGHLESYFGSENPTLAEIQRAFVMFGLCHWRKVQVLDCIKIKRVFRLALRVEKIKATEYTGVRNGVIK